jgi:hypothetical protein
MIEDLHQYTPNLGSGPLEMKSSGVMKEEMTSFLGKTIVSESTLTSRLSPNAHGGIDLAICPQRLLRSCSGEQRRHKRQE